MIDSFIQTLIIWNWFTDWVIDLISFIWGTLIFIDRIDLWIYEHRIHWIDLRTQLTISSTKYSQWKFHCIHCTESIAIECIEFVGVSALSLHVHLFIFFKKTKNRFTWTWKKRKRTMKHTNHKASTKKMDNKKRMEKGLFNFFLSPFNLQFPFSFWLNFLSIIHIQIL